jgi:hypothetical protein
MDHQSIIDHTVRPAFDLRLAFFARVRRTSLKLAMLALMASGVVGCATQSSASNHVGTAAPVAWAEAPAQSDTRARIELYGGAAEILDQDEHPWNVGLSYIWRPMGRWGIAPGVGGMYAEHDASAFYGELRKDFWLGRQWVVTPKLAAGVYHNGGGGLELGNEFEFREGLVLSWVGPRLRLGIGFYHASNGGLGENNPGTEVLEVVLGFPVGTTSK